MLELLLILGGVWLLSAIISSFASRNKDRSGPGASAPTSQATPRDANTPRSTINRSPPQTFKPTTSSNRNTAIRFKETAADTNSGGVPSIADLDGLHDAFTGAPLDKNLGLHQCQKCKVYYHTDSLQILREVNGAQCVACQSTNIMAVVSGGRSTGGRDYTPEVVTLENYKNYVGSVVTFEGVVHKIIESRRGNDFAVMFENESWAKGFKLVFFKDALRKVGGRPYVTGLKRKTVKVRGLVVNHNRFGYEIIVSEKSMILSVK